MSVFSDRLASQEDVRALALEQLERELFGETAQVCDFCGCGNPPDSYKCDDCGYDLPALQTFMQHCAALGHVDVTEDDISPLG